MGDLVLDKAHCAAVLQSLYENAIANKNCDIEILVQGSKFGAHKCILINASVYFEKMFSGFFWESKSGVVDISLSVANKEIFEIILKYMYLGVIKITPSEVDDILFTSQLMLLDDLTNKCAQYLLENLTIKNCIKTWTLAYHFSLTSLEMVCNAFTRNNYGPFLQNMVNNMSELPVELLAYFVQCGLMEFVALDDISPNLNSLAGLNAMETDHSSSFHMSCTELTEIHSPIDQEDMINHTLKNEPSEYRKCLMMKKPGMCHNEYTLCVYDLLGKNWYESGMITQDPPIHMVYTPRYYLTSIEGFIVSRRPGHDSNQLDTLDVKAKTFDRVLPPTYCFKKTQSIFRVGNYVLFLASMPEWALPAEQSTSDDSSTYAGEEQVLDFAKAGDENDGKPSDQENIATAHHNSPKVMNGRKGTPDIINQCSDYPIDLSLNRRSRDSQCAPVIKPVKGVSCEATDRAEKILDSKRDQQWPIGKEDAPADDKIHGAPMHEAIASTSYHDPQTDPNGSKANTDKISKDPGSPLDFSLGSMESSCLCLYILKSVKEVSRGECPRAEKIPDPSEVRHWHSPYRSRISIDEGEKSTTKLDWKFLRSMQIRHEYDKIFTIEIGSVVWIMAMSSNQFDAPHCFYVEKSDGSALNDDFEFVAIPSPPERTQRSSPVVWDKVNLIDLDVSI